MTKKKTLFKQPGSPILGKAALEEKLAVKGTLDMDEDELEEETYGLESEVTTEALKREKKEAKRKH